MAGKHHAQRYRISHPDRRLVGRIGIPGSKSESNRLLVLNHLFFPQLRIQGLSDSEDTRRMQSCLADRGNFIHVADAGTVMRFLTAYFAIRDGREHVLMGSRRMHERPVGNLVEALQSMGADIRYLEKEGYPPLKIFGRRIVGGEVSLDAGISSQFISALMMIGPALKEGLKINLKGLSVSAPYIYMTANLMRRLGFVVRVSDSMVEVLPEVPDAPKEFHVEPDWSAASYWYLLVLLAEKAEIYLPGFNQHSLQGDAMVGGLFESLGVNSHFIGSGFRLQKSDSIDKTARINLLHNPDLAQTMAVAYAALNMEAEIYGLQSLRIKETDRLLALQQELAKTGAQIEIGGDYLKVKSGIRKVSGVEFETYGDHRMAMALAPLSLLGEVVINDPGVVGKSYRSFWGDLQKVGFVIHKEG